MEWLAWWEVSAAYKWGLYNGKAMQCKLLGEWLHSKSQTNGVKKLSCDECYQAYYSPIDKCKRPLPSHSALPCQQLSKPPQSSHQPSVSFWGHLPFYYSKKHANLLPCSKSKLYWSVQAPSGRFMEHEAQLIICSDMMHTINSWTTQKLYSLEFWWWTVNQKKDSPELEGDSTSSELVNIERLEDSLHSLDY